MGDLSQPMRRVLSEMASGRTLHFSSDGEVAWLSPRRDRQWLKGFAPEEVLDGEDGACLSPMMKAGFIAIEGEHEHWLQPYRITKAGRAALASEGQSDPTQGGDRG